MLRCCQSSGWHTALVLGAAGFAGGLVVASALQGRSAPAAEPVLETVSFQQEGQPEAQPEAQPSPEESMEQMKELSRPVAEHDVLKWMEGDWDCQAKFYMQGPDQPPQASAGTSRHRLVLGGRYLVQHFQLDEFMGGPFEGMGIVGFDRATETYVNDWIDNWSTGIMSMKGDYDGASKTMDWRGVFLMPGPAGPVEMPSHHVIKHPDENTMVMEFWHPGPDGAEQLGGEITYTRRR
jgi:hypothetical protein